MRRRRTRERPRHLCLVAGCGLSIPGWKRICDEHWRQLPFDRRRAIAEAGQAGARHIVARLALEAAAWLEDHGPAAEAARRAGERE